MTNSNTSSAQLFIATGCTHCPVVLNTLSELLKNGQLSTLSINNISVEDDKSSKLNIRSVPWFSINNNKSSMVFTGTHSVKEIKKWVSASQTNNGMREYIEEFLKSGQLMDIVQAINLTPETFSIIIEMLEDEETSMQIRIGLDALIENFSGSEILKTYASAFNKIASQDNVRLQIDALHYLALTANKSQQNFLREKTKDDNKQIRDAATDALETLNDLLSKQ